MLEENKNLENQKYRKDLIRLIGWSLCILFLTIGSLSLLYGLSIIFGPDLMAQGGGFIIGLGGLLMLIIGLGILMVLSKYKVIRLIGKIILILLPFLLLAFFLEFSNVVY